MNQLENILSGSIGLFILVPLLAFFLSLPWQNKEEKIISSVALYAAVLYIVSAVAYGILWILNGAAVVNVKLVTLYQTDHFLFAIQFYYDKVTLVYSLVGSVLFFLVSAFSRYYMHRDEGYKRFFNTVLFFAAGYNLIIFSGNFETLFIGWEIIGLASFLLIAFYRNRYLPVKNAYKTLSNYRVSDLALIVAMWLLHHLTHQNITFTQLSSFNFHEMQEGHQYMSVTIALMFVIAAVIKSAQFPFSSWLPRAMEGPTSSSAIFYGSLSVHIGVFILLRTYHFWEDMLWVKIAVIAIGILTGLISTSIARVQPTVKTQIAYASSAQIGLIFIEVALGLHWLALIHFAGNAFLRTYQLLVSPSVLNYLVHHQYFHYHPPVNKPLNKLKTTIYTLSIKEWNLDTLMFKYLWSPFKWIGRKLSFLENKSFYILVVSVLFSAAVVFLQKENNWEWVYEFLPGLLLGIALLFILHVFASRGRARSAWHYLILSHFLIITALCLVRRHVVITELIFYASGILASYLLGMVVLYRIYSIDKDDSLNRYHGYVYEQKGLALLFLLAAVSMLGFPVTAAFIGIDVFFTYIHVSQYILLMLLALCFLFIELAAIRIFIRIFAGPHKKLYHPVAFRSS